MKELETLGRRGGEAKVMARKSMKTIRELNEKDLSENRFKNQDQNFQNLKLKLQKEHYPKRKW